MMKTIEVTPAMQQIFEHIQNKKNVYFFGEAGSGKSVTIKFLKSELEKQGKTVYVTASTGTAAKIIDGKTLHSALGIRRDAEFGVTKKTKTRKISNESLIKQCVDAINLDNFTIFDKDQCCAADRENKFDVLIIDECSMINCLMLEGINRTLKTHLKSDQPFGGVTVVLVGDFFQFPPVIPSTEQWKTHVLRTINSSSEHGYAFEAPCWKEFTSIELTTQFRNNRGSQQKLLSKLKRDELSNIELEKLNTIFTIDSSSKYDGLILTETRELAKRFNESHLNSLISLGAKSEIYMARVPKNAKLKEQDFEKAGFQKSLKLTIGCKVLCTINQQRSGFFNGTLGKVTQLSKDFIRISIDRSEESKTQVTIARVKSTIEINGQEIVVEQFPLTLAAAITIHKSQGMTLDKYKVVLLEQQFFEASLYVALSRAKDLSNVTVNRPIKMSDIKTNPTVLDFHNNLSRNAIKAPDSLGKSISHVNQVFLDNEENTVQELRDKFDDVLYKTLNLKPFIIIENGQSLYSLFKGLCPHSKVKMGESIGAWVDRTVETCCLNKQMTESILEKLERVDLCCTYSNQPTLVTT